MNYVRFFLGLLCAVPALVLGHAGCHKAPGEHAAPHGGLLEHNEHILVELVDTQNPMEIYVLDGNLNPIPAAKAKVKATLELPPRSRATGEVRLEDRGSFHAAYVTTKGRVHRYTLVVEVTDADGDVSTVNFQVEP
ncbi:MAG: hypothetical protein KDK78_01010 [Chlamydiia bacterium]|nr:hypothetical protein [Chlamydiia bacterium]